MRSSKSRQRNKQNRNRSVGNNINRVFDSSGPEGKVRGTPQQIIEKYTQLARDAQLSNDRVAAENFQQHAEHYTRMLGEAMREMEAQRQQNEQFQNRDGQRRDYNNGQGEAGFEPGEDMAETDEAPADYLAPEPVLVVSGDEEQPDIGPDAFGFGGVPAQEAPAFLNAGGESERAPRPRRDRRPPRRENAPEAAPAGDSDAS